MKRGLKPHYVTVAHDEGNVSAQVYGIMKNWVIQHIVEHHLHVRVVFSYQIGQSPMLTYSIYPKLGKHLIIRKADLVLHPSAFYPLA